MIYIYTAVFYPDPSENNKNLLSVYFPDLPGCVTCGDNLHDALEMAKDVLCLCLYDMEEDDRDIPDATPPQDIKAKDGGFTTLISVDTNYYRRFYANQPVAN